MVALVCFLIWLAGSPARAEHQAEGGGVHNTSPLLWLIETVTLQESRTQVASWFGHPPQVQHAGPITMVSFSHSPGPEPAGHPAHTHEEGRDACNVQPQWSFQFRAGRLESVVWHPPNGLATELPEALGRAPRSVIRSQGGGFITAWRLGPTRILLAVGGAPEREMRAVWVLMRAELVKSVYPQLAAFAAEDPPPSPR